MDSPTRHDLTWYAFRVESGQERRALRTLLELGYTPFLPIERRRRRRHRHAKSSQVVEYAKFPGYIFIGFAGRVPWTRLWAIDRAEPMASLTGHPSQFVTYKQRVLKSVIGFEGRPSPADGDQMHRAIAESSAYVPDTTTTRKGFEVGDEVEIIDGAWQGHVTKVDGIYGDKAKVFLQLFGSQREVKIDLDSLQAA